MVKSTSFYNNGVGIKQVAIPILPEDNIELQLARVKFSEQSTFEYTEWPEQVSKLISYYLVH